MKRVSVDQLSLLDERQVLRILTETLGATDLAINHYNLSPGDRIGGYHAHHDQEEVFYVLPGSISIETPDGDIGLGPDEAIRFARGEFHMAYNDGDAPVAALGLGGPTR